MFTLSPRAREVLSGLRDFPHTLWYCYQRGVHAPEQISFTNEALERLINNGWNELIAMSTGDMISRRQIVKRGHWQCLVMQECSRWGCAHKNAHATFKMALCPYPDCYGSLEVYERSVLTSKDPETAPLDQLRCDTCKMTPTKNHAICVFEIVTSWKSGSCLLPLISILRCEKRNKK